jgi:hypothetical protein
MGAVAAASVDAPVVAGSAAEVVAVVVSAVSSFLLQAAVTRAMAATATRGFSKDMEGLFVEGWNRGRGVPRPLA